MQTENIDTKTTHAASITEQTAQSKRRASLWVGIIILSGLLVCLLTDEKKSQETKEESKEDSTAFFEKELPLKLDGVSTGIFDKIQELSRDDALVIFEKKAKEAMQIIPQFPDFPKIWLLPPTEKGSYGSKAERYCIEFMELLFSGHRFQKVRPDWLRNPETNHCLELDGYCEQLSLAIEYNGIQHYVWPNFLPMNYEQFLKQRGRDQLKSEICIERNICLLIIPYTVAYEKLPLAIYAKLLDAAGVTTSI
jgi:hypothetical protein